MNKKVIEVLKSKNFLTTFIGLVLLGFSANGADFGTADQIYTLFSQKGSELLSAILVFTINSGGKIYTLVSSGKFSWDFLKSQNFQTASLTVITILLSAFFDEITVGVIVSIVLNILNLIIHLKEPVKVIPEVQ